MHIRSNIEHNVIDVVILAICPLLMVLNDAKTAMYYIAATVLCLFVSALFCLVFNKFLSKTMKVFITAVLSTFLITVFNYLISTYNVLGLSASDNNYFAILSTIVMSIDIYYIDTKAAVNNYFIRVLSTLFVFAVVTTVYVVIKEFLSIGTIFGWKPFVYSGFEFFNTVVFDLILMGFVCAVSSLIYRKISKKIQERSMAYAKLLKQIKNERVFQYDALRRQKLLSSDVEIKYVDNEEIETIMEKDNQNTSLSDLVEDDGENKNGSKTVIKRKKSKLKVSKETKVQQVFDKTSKEGK